LEDQKESFNTEIKALTDEFQQKEEALLKLITENTDQDQKKDEPDKKKAVKKPTD